MDKPHSELVRESMQGNYDVNAPLSLAALLGIGVLGSIVFAVLPLIVGTMSDYLPLSSTQVGVLASADMAGMFVAAVFATYWIRKYPWRPVATAAVLVLVVCHLLSTTVDTYLPLLSVRFLSGLVGGSLMSIAFAGLADTAKPDRWFGFFIAGQMVLGAAGLYVLPDMIASFQMGGIFYLLAAVVSLAIIVLRWLPADVIAHRSKQAGTVHAASTSFFHSCLLLFACFLFNAGIMMVWAYMERIGVSSNLDADIIGKTLSASMLVGLVGAVLAGLIADRFGRAIPLAITIICQVVVLAMLADVSQTWHYVVAVLVFAFFWSYTPPYQMGVLVSVDTSGRFVVLFLAAVKLGYTAGPALTGLLYKGDGWGATLTMSAMMFFLSFVLFFWLNQPRQKTSN